MARVLPAGGTQGLNSNLCGRGRLAHKLQFEPRELRQRAFCVAWQYTLTFVQTYSVCSAEKNPWLWGLALMLTCATVILASVPTYFAGSCRVDRRCAGSRWRPRRREKARAARARGDESERGPTCRASISKSLPPSLTDLSTWLDLVPRWVFLSPRAEPVFGLSYTRYRLLGGDETHRR
jgi:hypothetical protein